MGGLARTRVSPNALTAAGVGALPGRRGRSSSSSTATSSSSTGSAPRSSWSARARHPRRRAGAHEQQGDAVRRVPRLDPDRVGEGAMLRLDRADLRAAGQLGGAGVRDRGDHRLVPRLVHACEGGDRSGCKGDVGIGSRAERVVVITAGLAIAPWGAARSGRSTCWPRPPGSPWCSASCRCARSFARSASTSALAFGRWPGKRSDVLVRMAADLKRRLADEVEQRGASLNDVAVGILASRFAVAFDAERPARNATAPRRRRAAAHAARAQGEARAPRRASVGGRSTTSSSRPSPRVSACTERNQCPHNGKVRSDDKVRVAIIGVGNCANSLLQGVEYYKDAARRPVRPRA